MRARTRAPERLLSGEIRMLRINSEGAFELLNSRTGPLTWFDLSVHAHAQPLRPKSSRAKSSRAKNK